MLDSISLSKAHCVVTGSSGLCGRRLVEMLVERGARLVTALDRCKPSPAFDLKNINNKNNPAVGVRVVEADLSDKEAVFRALEGADVVFHLAALVGPFYSAEDYERVNYEGSLTVLEACKMHGVKKLM
jgi:nucleoside-diphosphate-sugar epimerase